MALEHRRAVLLSDPRKPENLANILKDLSRLGEGTPVSEARRKDLADGMRSFRCRCTSLSNKLLYLHALRHGEGYYEDHDRDFKEFDRMTVLSCYAIYVSTRIEKVNSRVLELNDSGKAAVFSTALQEANRLFGKGACRLSIEELVRRYADFEPFITAALSSASLEPLIIPNARIHEELKHEVLRRFNSAMDRIYGPEEAA